MAIDTTTPAGETFKKLLKALHERRVGISQNVRWSQTDWAVRGRPGVQLLDDYFRGEPPLHSVAREWRPHLREFIRKGRLNIAELLVTSTANRMQLRDFRTAAANDELGDTKARELMRANDMTVKIREVHELMLAHGDSYGIITPPEAAGLGHPLFTAEDALEVITDDDPATGQTRAALKVYRDDWDAADYAFLFMPDGTVLKAVKRGATTMTAGGFRMSTGWEWDDKATQKTPEGVIPVVHFRNRMGWGEFENHLPTLDRINDKVANEWWIGKIQAFRQRAVKGLKETDDDGNEIDYTDVFISAPDALWQVPKDVEFWESTNLDLTPILTSIKHDLERLASVTSTMLNIITPDAAQGSAEGASLMREEHVFKVEDRRDRAHGKWAKAMSLMFLFAGDKQRADITQIEPIWGPAERYSLSAKADAASKAGTTLPREAIQRDIWQYDGADIPNLRQLAGRDLIFQPPAQPAAPAGG